MVGDSGLIRKIWRWIILPQENIQFSTYLFKRTFSGLRSQCITFASLRSVRVSSNCRAKTLTRLSDKPLKSFCLISSYRLKESSSNTKHRWFLWLKVWCSCSRWWWFFASNFCFSLKSISESRQSTLIAWMHFTSFTISTSMRLWFRYAGLFLITFTENNCPVLTRSHFTTWPNVPCPKRSMTLYLHSPHLVSWVLQSP